MKELVTIEKGRYNNLLDREQELGRVNKRLQDLHTKYTDLERRYFTLLTTKRLAGELINLGDYEQRQSVDTNV